MKLKIILFFLCLLLYLPLTAQADPFSRAKELVGKNGALILTDDTNRVVFEKNSTKKLVPASTLKVLTALSAFHYLGEDFRFKTEFYLDTRGNLFIKGYGDPLLTSEVLSVIADKIAALLPGDHRRIRKIITDGTYFRQPVKIPGMTPGSPEPYDANNGALCANFNTVFFDRDESGRIISGEKQTPILPYLMARIRETGLKKGRITISERESSLYAAHLIKYFLEKEGITVDGDISQGSVNREESSLLYTHVSPYSLSDTLEKLMTYSNNFTANQIFLAIGASVYGPPATLEKGAAAANEYMEKFLDIKDGDIVEGSGLSRKNKVSAAMLDTILHRFYPRRNLLKHGKGELYKTGTLSDVSTRIGYLTGKRAYRYVIMINSPGTNAAQVVDELRRALRDREEVCHLIQGE